MSTLKVYYDLLTRIDHPVFKRDFNEDITAESPFNSILNFAFAKQLERLRADIDEVHANKFPHLVTDHGIDSWEETYFQFIKTGKTLEQRKTELLIKVRSRGRMTVPALLKISEAITGLVPHVIRNLHFDGWTLGQSPLGIDTILPGSDQSVYSYIYRLSFMSPVDPELLARLNDELTRIEKAGSTHYIYSPPAP
ncbi:putative phage tail protein [Bdellovibrio bacteriovorus]|uniref:putative phage tail protein n=1 Tax=Bdellovibrio bacteriovorus TaxID=959 RepID=UPI003AA82495